MQNLNYTIRFNNKIVAKAEATDVAGMIASLYCKSRSTETRPSVKVIDNVFNRIAFNNKGYYHSSGHIEQLIEESRKRFIKEYKVRG